MVLHANADGEVIGVNGEYVDGIGISTIATLSSSQAVEIATASYFSSDDNFEIIGAALLTVVRTFDGDASFAYKVRVKYLAPDTQGLSSSKRTTSMLMLIRDDWSRSCPRSSVLLTHRSQWTTSTLEQKMPRPKMPRPSQRVV
jgi:hypothetical protein